jgi:phosphatidate cytidylyltransferase
VPFSWKDTSLTNRVLMSVLYGPIILLSFWYGGLPLYLLLTGIVIVGQWELFRMCSQLLGRPHQIVGYLSGLLIMAGTFHDGTSYLLEILIAALAGYFLIEIYTSGERKLEAVVMSFFITVYPALLTSYLLKIDKLPYSIFDVETRFILFIMLLFIWLFDSASYFAGRFWGREPFFPQVSPRKTREGFIGGFVSVLIMAIVVSWITNWHSFLHFLAIGILTALSGQAGDLAESLIKRGMGVKDSSNLIPGHGGILDRFDSLIFAGPIIYWYLLLCCRYGGGCS